MSESQHLKTLPRWAQVAFAARCVRRAQYLETFETESCLDCDEINDGVAFAERHATGSAMEADLGRTALFVIDADWERRVQEADATVGGWMDIYQRLGVQETCVSSARHAANAAIHASQGRSADCVESAWQAYLAVVHAAFIVREFWSDRSDDEAFDRYEAVLNDLYEDFRYLAELAGGEGMTDETFVPPEFFRREVVREPATG